MDSAANVFVDNFLAASGNIPNLSLTRIGSLSGARLGNQCPGTPSRVHQHADAPHLLASRYKPIRRSEHQFHRDEYHFEWKQILSVVDMSLVE